MEVIVGIPKTPAILLSSAVMVAYSVLGGMWSLTLTDIIQFVIKTVGIFFVLLPGAIIHAGGWAAMHAKLPPQFFSPVNIGWPKILSFFLLYFFGIIIGQDIWQRVFTARSVKVARNGGIGVGLYCAAYAAAGALIGTAAHAFLPPLADADAAFAQAVNAVLPAGLRGLVLAAALAAIMSTASACLLASSTVLLEDVYLPLRARRERRLGQPEPHRDPGARPRHDGARLCHARCHRGAHHCLRLSGRRAARAADRGDVVARAARARAR